MDYPVGLYGGREAIGSTSFSAPSYLSWAPLHPLTLDTLTSLYLSPPPPPPTHTHTQAVVASYDDVFPAVDEGAQDVDDNCNGGEREGGEREGGREGVGNVGDRGV